MNTNRLPTLCAATIFAIFGWTGAANAASLTLAWDPPTDQTITGYRVYYGTQSGVYPNLIDAGLQTSVVVSNLPDGSSYYFVVKSYDAAGLESAPSNEVASGVLGSTAPSITCPVLSTTSPDGNPVAVSYTGLVVSGGTSPLTTSCAPASGSLFPVGTTSFTCTVTDALGLTNSCSSTVTVNAPTASSQSPLQIACPVIAPVTSNSGKPVMVSYSSPTVTGGVAPVTTSCSPSSGSRFAVGTTPVTCTAVDAAQQQASCSTSVTVLPKTRR